MNNALINASRVFKEASRMRVDQLLLYVGACPILGEKLIPVRLADEVLESGQWTDEFRGAALAIGYPASFRDIVLSNVSDSESLITFALNVAERELEREGERSGN